MGFDPPNASYAISIINSSVSGLEILGRALDYRDTIDSFVSRHKDLHTLELSNTSVLKSSLVQFFDSKWGNWQLQLVATLP
jgi:hypothetical protein